jgi:DNA-binding IclR family transcriptional regulator
VRKVTTIDRSFQIIEMLVDADDGLSLADIAGRLEVNKAIAAKLLATLTKLFYVLRDDSTQRYFATYRISNLGLSLKKFSVSSAGSVQKERRSC